MFDECSTWRRWLFEPVCALCGAANPAHDLCEACERALPWLRAACPQCARPQPVAVTCGACQQRPPAFARTHALFQYRPPVDRWIQRFKYHGDLAAGALLARLVARFAPATSATLALPVPLHPRRLRARGYNQALELARGLHRSSLTLNAHALSRVRPTRAQVDLPPERRRSNVRGAFAATPAVKGRDVILLDDVMTTGETARAAAKALRAAGAASVTAWVVARA